MVRAARRGRRGLSADGPARRSRGGDSRARTAGRHVARENKNHPGQRRTMIVHGLTLTVSHLCAGPARLGTQIVTAATCVDSLRVSGRGRSRSERGPIRQHQHQQQPTAGGAASSAHAGANASVHDDHQSARSHPPMTERQGRGERGECFATRPSENAERARFWGSAGGFAEPHCVSCGSSPLRRCWRSSGCGASGDCGLLPLAATLTARRLCLFA